MAWTKEQLMAINTEGGNIIVSAGAGSGKTAVLTSRVIRKLKSGIHINNLLVLTFTNAAAAEMKERIRRSIKKTEGLEEEANLIDGAYITTFDSFSLSVVKKYHTKLNITNKIKISDNIMIDIEKRKILDNIFDRYYESNNEAFNNLIKDFCLKNDNDLKKYILNVYQKIELKYDKDTYLNNYFEIENSDKIDNYIDEYVDLLKEKQESIKELLREADTYFDGEFTNKMILSLGGLLNARCYDDFLLSCDVKSPRVPKDTGDTAKEVKKAIYDIVKEIRDLCIYESTSDMKEEILFTKGNTKMIVEILKELDFRLTEYKVNNDIYNFTDISRMAIKVVEENKDIRDELKDSFNEILVDEYQDTSDTQEKFISLISNNNVYMVGDIKQSIYRFRNANPYIFKNKYNTYRDTSEGTKIDLLKNFRSRKEVLENINLLFDLFMDERLGGADYQESHRMVFGNNTYIEKGSTEQNYDFSVITYPCDLANITKDEEEAFIIGEDIKDKVTKKYQVFDKDKELLRDITYSDFVILLDKSKNFDLYKKIFEYLHIPLNILKEESLSKDDDIIVLRNLLRLIICIKEKKFDIEFKYTFTSICRSFLYKMNDNEIYNYLVNNNYKSSSLYKKCEELTAKIDYVSATEFIRDVLSEFNYEEKLLTIHNIKSFRVRCEYFYNLISDYASTGKTVYDFVQYLTEIFESSSDLKFNINTPDSNSCKIMTIHKSKGLEFPICYFAGFSSRFNMQELKEKILYDNRYGIILPKVDGYYKDTITKTLLKHREREEEISEKIRLLYVAVTRAKEKMIIVMPEVEEKEMVSNIVPIYVREKYNSFLSIMKSIIGNITPYIIKSDIVATKDYQKNNKEINNSLSSSNDNLVVNSINIETKEITNTHYSKDSIHLNTKDEERLMEIGTRTHKILEEIDFNNINNLEIDDEFIYNKVMKFINSDLMRDKLKNKMYKEYEFVYEEDNKLEHGIIDLLIDGDVMTIIDYKLKNIDDPQYDKQLNGYRKYIENITGKKTRCYLYSIIDSVYREVER